MTVFENPILSLFAPKNKYHCRFKANCATLISMIDNLNWIFAPKTINCKFSSNVFKLRLFVANFEHYVHILKISQPVVKKWKLARKNRWPKIWKWVCGPGNTTVKTTTPYAWACAWKNSCWMAPAAARAPPVRLLHCRMPFSCWETYPCVGWSRLVVVQQLRKRRARPWQQARLKLDRLAVDTIQLRSTTLRWAPLFLSFCCISQTICLVTTLVQDFSSCHCQDKGQSRHTFSFSQERKVLTKCDS